MLSSHQLLFEYPNGPGFRFPDLALAEGRSLLVLGKSGAGKTTLLHLLAGLLSPKSGAIRINETPLFELSSPERDRFRSRYMGFVFQKPHFISGLSILENLLLIQYLAKRKDKNRAEELLRQIGLKEKAAERPGKLSEGQRQRAAIAMALANNPKLVLADEPTSSLDDDSCLAVVGLLQQQAQQEGAALIIITHDQRLKQLFPDHVSL